MRSSQDNRKSGFIDKAGKLAILIHFPQARPFKSGIAQVILEDNKIGYIDRTGKFIWRQE